MSRRQAWFNGQSDLDPARLIFLDETWGSISMARRIGQAPRGHPLRVGVPHGHWKTATFVAGLRCDGIAAPFLLDEPINRAAFETYVAQVLVPDLRPRDIVMMDDLSSQKGPRVRDLIEAAGASLRYPPAQLAGARGPRSDFSPIEMAFAKLKALPRKAAERTVGALWDRLGILLDAFAPDECANYFAAAGSDAT